MSTSERSRSPLPRPAVAAVVLVVTLVVVNALAALGIAAARRDARRAARSELELRALAQGRAVEATIASLRADLSMLAQSPTLERLAPAAGAPADPLARRWSRLDAEATLLLFLGSRPAVEWIEVHRDHPGGSLRGGRRNEAPVMLPPEGEIPFAEDRVLARWSVPLAGSGELSAWIDPVRLLPPSDGTTARIELVVDPTDEPAAAGARDSQVATVTVPHEGWSPPAPWRLVRREQRGELARSLDLLAGRSGLTVVANLAVMAATLVLGWWTLRSIRQTARLEAEREQRERVRELERQVLHGDRLASVGRLAAGFAHEINNPLEGIANYLAALRDDLDSGNTGQARALADRASEGVARAAGVIRQILTFSEPGTAGKQPLDLREVIQGAASFVRSNPRYRHTEVRLALGADPLLVEGNSVTLGQLTLNLLLNALQAEPANGPVDVGAHGERETIVLEVRDRGPGVSPTVRDHLFEPFTSTRGSSGLGLAVCRGIASDHGGTIDVTDRDGGGAVFTVRLPRGATTAPALVPAGSET